MCQKYLACFSHSVVFCQVHTACDLLVCDCTAGIHQSLWTVNSVAGSVHICKWQSFWSCYRVWQDVLPGTVQQFVRISRSRFGCAFQSGLEDTRASVSESSSCMSLTAVVLLVISAVCFENHCEPNSLIQGGTEKSATYKLHVNILPSCGFISVDTWVKVYWKHRLNIHYN